MIEMSMGMSMRKGGDAIEHGEHRGLVRGEDHSPLALERDANDRARNMVHHFVAVTVEERVDV
jgi:hypothetical protein